MEHRLVLVKALKSFDGLTAGEVVERQMSRAIAHLIVSHYLQILRDSDWNFDAEEQGWRESGSTEQLSE